MANKCDICEKHSVAGGSHKHHRGVAGGQWKRRAQHTKRTIKPNLHRVTLPIKGVMTRVYACTKCIKRIRLNLEKKEGVTIAADLLNFTEE